MGMGRYRRLANVPMPAAPALPSSYSINPALSGLHWEELDVDQLFDILQCEQVLAGPRDIPDATAWRALRQTYWDVVGARRSSLRWEAVGVPASVPAHDATAIDAVLVPNKGRGLVARRDIQAGERLWSDVNLAMFHDVSDLNRFIAVLPTPRACDIILWESDYTEAPAEEFFYSVNLDLSSFCNDGSAVAANVAVEDGPVVNDFVAARDIAAGEEVLCDYNNGDVSYD